MKLDPRRHSGEVEYGGERIRQPADLELATVGDLRSAEHLIDGQRDPAPDPMDALEIEQEPVVAGLDQFDQVVGQLADVPLLHQGWVDQPDHRDAATIGDPEARPIREGRLGPAPYRPALRNPPQRREPLDELVPDVPRTRSRLDF